MLLPLGGCLVSTSTSHTSTGTRVSGSTYDQIEPGSTTSAWLQATLGDPTSRSSTDGQEVWKWRYHEEKHSHGTVFLIFSGSDVKKVDGSVCVELKDGVVTRKWKSSSGC